MNNKIKVFSGAPAVGKTTYMRRNGLETAKPELADNEELLKEFKPYLVDKSKLTFEVQHSLSEHLKELTIKHLEIDKYLDRTFLDGFALSLLQFIYYQKPTDLISMLDYIDNTRKTLSLKGLELNDKIEYTIFTTSWQNNLSRLKGRGRDIDENDIGWYEFCNKHFVEYMTFILNKFDIRYRVEIL